MSVYTRMQTANLKEMLKVLCHQVIGNVRNVIAAVGSLDADLAHSVVKRSQQIYRMELDILQACKDLLANETAAPADLQYAISILRVNADLERIVKQTVNVAHQITRMDGAFRHTQRPQPLVRQATAVTELVQKAIDAFLALNAKAASAAMAMDDAVDDCYGHMFNAVQEAIGENPDCSTEMEGYLHIAKVLERLADHAVSICEDVVDIAKH